MLRDVVLAQAWLVANSGRDMDREASLEPAARYPLGSIHPLLTPPLGDTPGPKLTNPRSRELVCARRRSARPPSPRRAWQQRRLAVPRTGPRDDSGAGFATIGPVSRAGANTQFQAALATDARHYGRNSLTDHWPRREALRLQRIRCRRGGAASRALARQDRPRRRPLGSRRPRVYSRAATRITSSVRGPWTPLTRTISMSTVADGPEMNVSGRVACSRARASGSELTSCSTRTTHR